jgi:hypothetical protein
MQFALTVLGFAGVFSIILLVFSVFRPISEPITCSASRDTDSNLDKFFGLPHFDVAADR